MKLLTKAIEEQLIKNYELNNPKRGEHGKHDLKPAVKFFGGGACTWLITEYNPDSGLFFGLCDLGMGEPELGYVSKQELEETRFAFGLGVERDLYWKADKTLQEYADAARIRGAIES